MDTLSGTVTSKRVLLFNSFMAPTRELLFVVIKFESISDVLKALPLTPSNIFDFHPYSFGVRKKYNNSVSAANNALIYK